MPPRLNFYGAGRLLAICARPSIASHQPRIIQTISRRGFVVEKDPKPATGLNQDVLGRMSEEAADMVKVTGETEPDLGQGTLVQDVGLQSHLNLTRILLPSLQKDKLLTDDPRF